MLFLALTALTWLLVPLGSSNDLRALWLAAEAFATGGDVYPEITDLYTMSPPSSWAEAYPGETLYPYLYPPIWAVLMAPLTDLPFETVTRWVHGANAAMLAGAAMLAWRITGARLALPIFAGVGLLLLTQTFVGSLALLENQPQILVSFLILLAIEREKSGACVMAGAILAFAAALKVYPVLFALLWLATGNRHATIAFALMGGGLGLLSILVAGWPLHAHFLDTLGMIGNGVILTPVSYAITPALAQFAAKGAFLYHETASGGWLVLALSPMAGFAAKGALLLALVLLAVSLRRAEPDTRYALLWPMAVVVVSLLAPLSWAYHYIPAIALAPVLLDRLGTRTGAFALLAVGLPLSPVVAGLLLEAGLPAEHLQIAGTVALTGLALLFAKLAYQPSQQVTA